MLLHVACAFEVITLPNERVIALFHHFFLQLRHIVEIDQKVHNTATSRPPVPCILQILTTFNLYSGRPRVGLSVNNKQKVRQAMVKISRGGWQSGLTIRGLKYSYFNNCLTAFTSLVLKSFCRTQRSSYCSLVTFAHRLGQVP